MSNLPIVQVLVNFTDESAPPKLSMTSATDLSFGDGRSIGTVATLRGRSTELGAVQTGTCTAEVIDPRETLNPSNTASPFQQAPNRLLPYRGLGVRAWWPLTGNMINAATYEAGATGGGSDSTFETRLWSVTTGTVALAAPDSSVIRLTANGPAASASPLTAGLDALTSHYWTIPGQTHTYSVWVQVATPGTEVWLTAAGEESATAGYSDGLVRIHVTFEPTANRTPIVLHIEGGPPGTATQIVDVDREQLELAEAPTAWVPTGPVRYRRWTGYVERWPLTWQDRGFTGVRPLEGADARGVAARTQIRDDYADLVVADGATVYLPLDETGPPAHGSGPIGDRILLRERLATRGSSVSWGGATLPDGTRCVQMSQQIQNPADVPWRDQQAKLLSRIGDTEPAALFGLDTRGATVEGWVRVFAGSARAHFQVWRDGAAETLFGFSDTGISQHQVYFSDRATSTVRAFPSSRATADGTTLLADSYIDTEWHYFALTFEPDPADTTTFRIRWRFDGETSASRTALPHRVINVNTLELAAFSTYGDPESRGAFARFAVYPTALTDAATLTHYQRGTGYEGETVQARVTRLLTRWWRGPSTVHAGAGRPLGPDFALNGGSLLTALDETAAADDGLCIAEPGGPLEVQSSLTRPRKAAAGPAAVLGEDTSAGELPYQGIEYDFDPGNLYSSVSMTRPGRSSPLVLTDPEVEALVGPRTLSRTVPVRDDYELHQVALTYLTRYGQARLRVKKITFHPHANPELWPALLALDVSDRVTVRRRVPAGFVMDDDFYVESVRDDIDKAASTWSITFELSPVVVDRPWVLGDPSRGVLGSTTTPVH